MGEQYRRKRGRKQDENKGRGREPWCDEAGSSHSSRSGCNHVDSGATATTNGCGRSPVSSYLFILLKDQQPRGFKSLTVARGGGGGLMLNRVAMAT